MKNTKFVLLTIGILGVLASFYGTVTGMDYTINLVGYICGSSLIFGYFDMKKKEDRKTC